MSKHHPCPAPGRMSKRELRDGMLWACKCGAVHVLRNDWNYAGDVWRWHETSLRIENEAKP